MSQKAKLKQTTVRFSTKFKIKETDYTNLKLQILKLKYSKTTSNTQTH